MSGSYERHFWSNGLRESVFDHIPLLPAEGIMRTYQHEAFINLLSWKAMASIDLPASMPLSHYMTEKQNFVIRCWDLGLSVLIATLGLPWLTQALPNYHLLNSVCQTRCKTFKKIFYFAVPGLSCSTRESSTSLRQVESLSCSMWNLLVAACGIQFFD